MKLTRFSLGFWLIAILLVFAQGAYSQGEKPKTVSSQARASASLRGTVTDPSGASVPGALVQFRGLAGEQRTKTDTAGQYSFAAVRPGKYLVRIIAKGFSVWQEEDFEVSGSSALDIQLVIQPEAQVINVEEEVNRLSIEPSSNVGALVLGEKELAVLSDDPEELAQQLQALAGPAAGPSGGQIYIDNFAGGTLPPKASIREVRINSNPYSPEYERPGFGRIEIFTKPGTDTIRGQAFLQYNKEALNSRSPLLTQSKRPPYKQQFYGFNLSGPIKKQKASFGLDVERRTINENAFILATVLDDNLSPLAVNQTILTPQSRMTISPRLDYSINTRNTLTARYQNTRSEQDKEGIGNFSLASRAYNQTNSENLLQVTETAIFGTKAINELRFQNIRTNLARTGDNTIPALIVQGAFEGGGAQVGNSGSKSNRWELANTTTYTHKNHIIKWGARLRRTAVDDTSVNNFGGTFTFFGDSGPVLDTNNQPTSGALAQLSAFERYRRTLFFQQAGLSPTQIRQLGGGASQFSLSAGTPTISIGQSDIGLFLNDDWRARPNLTLSYGLRYETQTNISDLSNLSPRIGVAWGIGGGPSRITKTVLRAGFGAFYERISETVTLQARRFNGQMQQSYLILNPDFFPTVPTPAMLESGRQPQRLQSVDGGILAPRTYQASVGIERQVNKYTRLSMQYISSRGVHLQRSRDINAPINGVFPFSDSQLRLLTESTGFSRSNQFIISPTINFKKVFLFGFYALSHGKTDTEGAPADPYNLRAEWGPSSFSDVRHRLTVGTSLPLLWNFSVSPFFSVSSSSPYNITTGRDTNGDGFTSERPALLTGIGVSDCRSGDLIYEPRFGCFNLNPAPGTAIGRNFARGPATVNFNLRLSRTWGFGSRGAPGQAGSPTPPEMGGPGRGGSFPGGGPPGGQMSGRGRGSRGGGEMFTGRSDKKYNLTLSISANNVLNHANYAPPSGDLSSPFFGEYRSLVGGFGPRGGGSSTYNRKIDVQLRFTF